MKKELTEEEKMKKEQFNQKRKEYFEKQKKGWNGFWAEFKKFISKGNVLDMAIAVVIGAAFSKIVSSLVSDIITPLITLLFGKQSLNEFVIVLREATEEIAALTLNYGAFIQNIVDFLIQAFTLFVVLRLFLKAQSGFVKLTKKQKKALSESGAEVVPEVVDVPKAPTQEELLTEIRDLLKSGKESNTKDKE